MGVCCLFVVFVFSSSWLQFVFALYFCSCDEFVGAIRPLVILWFHTSSWPHFRCFVAFLLKRFRGAHIPLFKGFLSHESVGSLRLLRGYMFVCFVVVIPSGAKAQSTHETQQYITKIGVEKDPFVCFESSSLSLSRLISLVFSLSVFSLLSSCCVAGTHGGVLNLRTGGEIERRRSKRKSHHVQQMFTAGNQVDLANVLFESGSRTTRSRSL